MRTLDHRRTSRAVPAPATWTALTAVRRMEPSVAKRTAGHASSDRAFVEADVLRPRRTCALGTATGGELEDEELAPSKPTPPQQAGAAATIVCDGRGGYRVAMNSWAGAGCGIEACVRRHEQSHATDWRRRWPNGCKDKADGADIPLGGAGYDAFLKASECTAYGVEESCITPLYNAAVRGRTACEGTLRTHLTDTRAQKASYCGR